jgi:ubiquinone/menaquinone biosynthesis C-methylase UbiE
MLARRGARVTAIDVSAQAARMTSARAEANQVDGAVRLCQMGTEQLAFRDGSFDLVIGFGILHHLDLQAAAPEIRRVLKPGGQALFREPLGENPLLELARDRLPYRGKARSPNETPLTVQMINTAGRSFRDVQIREMYLFSMIGRVWGNEAVWSWLWRFDEWLIRRLPWLRRLCRYAVIVYRV